MKVLIFILAVTLTLTTFAEENAVNVDTLSKDVSTDDLLEMDLSQLLEVEVVTASKKAQNIKLAPADMIVISEKQIKERGYKDLKDIFKDLPGFDISENVEGEIRTIVTGRGLVGNNKIMVLLDGKKLNTTTGERFVYGNNIPLFNIKQIEIIYGPSSAMYGADAYAGVINMISKTPEEINGFATDFFYDSNQTFNESIVLGKKVNDSFSIILDARRYDSGGVDVTNFSEYKTDGYKAINDDFIQPTHNYNIYTKVKLNDFTLGYYRMDANEPNGYSTNPDWYIFDKNYVWHQKINKIFGDHEYSAYSDKLHLTSSFEYSDYEVGNESCFNYPDSSGGVAYKYAKTSSFKMEEKLSLQLPSGFDLSAGLSFEMIEAFPKTSNLSKKFNEDILFDNMSPGYEDGVMGIEELNGAAGIGVRPFNKFGVYSELTKKIGEDLQINAGVRYDYASNYSPDNTNDLINPRIGVIWAPKNTTVKLLYGEAYIQPSEYDKWENFVAGDFLAHIPNLNLEAETLKSINLIFSQKILNYANVEASLFYNWANSIIRPAQMASEDAANNDFIMSKMSDTAYIETNVNTGSQETRGGELKVQFFIENLQGYLYYSYLDATDIDDETDKEYPISKTSNHKVHFGLTYTLLKNYSASFRGRWIDKANAVVGNVVKEDVIDSYFTADLSLRADFNFGLAVYLNATNIFDEKYYAPSPFGEGGWIMPKAPQPGRTIFAGLSYKF